MITGLSATTIPTETFWTIFLTSITSKIPYVGIPIAISLGLVGTLGITWMINTCGFAYQDWYKEYYTK